MRSTMMDTTTWMQEVEQRKEQLQGMSECRGRQDAGSGRTYMAQASFSTGSRPHLLPVGKNGGPEGPPSADPKASAVVSSMNQRRDSNPPSGRRLYGKLRTYWIKKSC